jgi:hypothetical protein
VRKEQNELDALKEEYLSQLRGLFPLYRVALFFVALVIVIAVQNLSSNSIILGLLRVEVRLFADFDQGYFATVIVQDILVAMGLLILGSVIHKLFRWLAFIWLRKSLKLDGIAKSMTEKSAALHEKMIPGYFALRKSEANARNWGNKVSAWSLISESALMLSVLLVYAGYFGNFTDYTIGFAAFLCALLAQAKSFIVFLKHYLPHAMHIKGLMGQSSDIKLPNAAEL